MVLPVGILAGLTATVGWGVYNYTAALASRSIGAVRALMWTSVIASSVWGLFALMLRSSISLNGGALLQILGVSGVLTLASLILFRALERGRISFLVPLSATWPMVTIPIALVFFRKTPTRLQLTGALLMMVGVIIASLNWQELIKRYRVIGSDPGTVWIVTAIVLFGVGNALYAPLVRAQGWLQTGFWSWLFGASLIFIFASIKKETLLPPLHDRRRTALIVTGLSGVTASMLYAFALTKVPISILAPMASFSSIISAVLAYSFLKERLSMTQLAGISVAIAGLLIVSLYS